MRVCLEDHSHSLDAIEQHQLAIANGEASSPSLHEQLRDAAMLWEYLLQVCQPPMHLWMMMMVDSCVVGACQLLHERRSEIRTILDELRHVCMKVLGAPPDAVFPNHVEHLKPLRWREGDDTATDTDDLSLERVQLLQSLLSRAEAEYDRLRAKIPLLKDEIKAQWRELSISPHTTKLAIDYFVASDDQLVFISPNNNERALVDTTGTSNNNNPPDGIFGTVLALEARRNELDKQLRRLKETVHLLFPVIVSLWDELDVEITDRNPLCRIVLNAPYSHEGVDHFLADLSACSTRFPLQAIEAVRAAIVGPALAIQG